MKNKETTFKPNENFNHFLYWICERQNIFWKKYKGLSGPWTEDPILQQYKFTNTYRCLDRVSQYLLRNVIYNGKQYEPEDMFFRILVFKHFNSCETWDMLTEEFGDITYETGWDTLADFCEKKQEEGVTLYSRAYIINCQFYQLPQFQYIKGMSKCRAHFTIFEDNIFKTGVLYDMLAATTFEELYNLLRTKVGIFGDFTAQQYTIDYGYSPLFNFTENEFVVTGPGSIRGIDFTFDGVKRKEDYIKVIHWVHDNFEELMNNFCAETGMEWNPLPWEKVPTLTNLQNCFCETSKFAKGLGHQFNKRKQERIKTEYQPVPKKIDYVFPPKWNAVLPKPEEIDWV